jgi:hypothetical protein
MRVADNFIKAAENSFSHNTQKSKPVPPHATEALEGEEV